MKYTQRQPSQNIGKSKQPNEQFEPYINRSREARELLVITVINS